MESSRTARVRAAAIAVLVLVHGWMAAPLPHKVTEGRIKRPEAQEELRRWHGLLGRLGVALTEAELAHEVVSWSTWIAELKQQTTKPLRPLLKLTGTGQGWALFSAPDTFPSRLEIHARIEGEWVPVFRRLDPAYTLLADELGFRRMRGVYDGTGLSGPYSALADWAAARVFAELPEADAVRVRLLRMHSARPDAREPAKTEKARQVKIVERP